ncbi:MAG TPA: Yip1 family protein [Thermoanaerobaculia bacterium]|nr:Yip1 family protein [Thermoanaerobaculia bacterium]
MTATDVVPPSAAEPETPNTFSRIIGVLFSPGETFESIVKRPNILGPLLIFIIISIASSIAVAMKADFNSLAREAVEQNPNITADKVDGAVSMTKGIMKVSMYASPVLITLMLVIAAGVLLLAFKMFGGEGDFNIALSVTTYAWFPRLIRGVLGAVVMLTKGSMSLYDLQNPIMSNLGFLFDPKTQPVQYAIGSSLDLFNLWTLVLLIIGFAAMSRLSKVRSAVIIIVLWLVVNLLSLIGPAMQAKRLNQ